MSTRRTILCKMSIMSANPPAASDNMHVQHTIASEMIAKSTEQAMAWARDDASGRLVHISMLSREQTGLRCGCRCPACAGLLQAVNAGRGVEHYAQPRARRPFFRHDAGQQRDACLLRAAQLAALQLLTETGEIELPAHNVRHPYVGGSGDIYTGQAHRPAQRVRVILRTWVDEQRAIITLADGKRVLVQLQATMRTPSGPQDADGGPGEGEPSGLDAIITIRVDDPDVAGWGPEQILQHAVAEDGLACWSRHWDDGQMLQDAERQALEQARQAQDLMPDELQAYSDLPASLRYETYLHWTLKELLASLRWLEMGPWNETITAHASELGDFTTTVHLAGCILNLSQIRLEQRMQGMIPDVLCTAEDRSGKLGRFPLMIEVAVTHRIESEKLERIQRANVACIEIDIRQLARSGRIRREQLRTELQRNIGIKRWVHLPYMARRIAQETQALQALRDNKLAEFHLARERQLRLSSLSDVELVQAYLVAIAAWPDQPCTRDKDTNPYTLFDLEGAVLRRQVLAPAFYGEMGVLRSLDVIRAEGRGRKGGFPNSAQVIHKAASDPSLTPYIGLLLMARRVYNPPMDPDQKTQIDRLAQEVRGSIERGRDDFARPTQDDTLIAQLFPELRPLLDKPWGTKAAVAQIRRDQAARSRPAPSPAPSEQDIQAAIQAERARERRRALDVLAHKGWQPPLGMNRSVEQMLAIREVQQLLGRSRPSHHDELRRFLEDAWEARARGVPLDVWLLQQDPDLDVRSMASVLMAAWLVL